MDVTNTILYPAHPEDSANIINKFTFWWILDIAKKRLKREIREEDIYEVYKKFDSKFLGDLLESAWNEELRKIEQGKNGSLFTAVCKTFWKPFLLWSVVGGFSNIILRIGQIYLLSLIVEYFSKNSTISTEMAYVYCSMLVLSMITCNILTWKHYHALNSIGTQIRVALSSLIYRKIMKLKNTCENHGMAGHAVTLMTTDVQYLDYSTVHIAYLVIAPLQVLAASYIGWLTCGKTAFIGIGCLLLVALVGHYYVGKCYFTSKPNLAKRTSERVKLMSEIIYGIKVIKMYAWENAFAKIVHMTRRLEMKYLKRIILTYRLIITETVAADRLSLFFVLVIYSLTGNHITPTMTYGLLQMFNTVKIYILSHFSHGLTSYASMRVALQRTQKFLMLKEIPEQPTSLQHSVSSNVALEIREGSAKWMEDQVEDTLHNINITVSKGGLCAIVGVVGSGKSSLLQVMLRELPLTKGSLCVSGNISLASQDSWIFVGTVRENILFGEPFHKDKYESVTDACALVRDIEMLPHGDETLIGEKGITLSGGQRARISLARAVYKDADIYLLDDPLSAVDTRVGQHIFEKCIVGYLSRKTRILVTHQLQYLKEVDSVFLLCNGSVETSGVMNEVAPHLSNVTTSQNLEDGFEAINEKNTVGYTKNNNSILSVEGSRAIKNNTNEEKQKTGSVDWVTYSSYIKAGGNILFLIFVLFILITTQLCISGADYFVAYWTYIEDDYLSANNNTNKNDLSLNWDIFTTGDFLIIYAIIIVIMLFFVATGFFVVTKFFTNVSQSLHDMMFEKVTKAEMDFFRKNPSGRILNRFSNDIGTIDEKLTQALNDSVTIFLMIVGIFINVLVVNIWTAIPMAICLILIGLILKMYSNVAASLKRLHSLTYSPVFTHIAQSLNGLTVIRSCKSANMVTKRFEQLLNRNTSCMYLVSTATSILALWLELICVTWFMGTALIFFLTPRDLLDATAGSALNQVLLLALILQFGLKRGFEAHSSFTSVERVLEYKSLKAEEDFNMDKYSLETWPNTGLIKFENVCLSYDENQDFVLKNISLTIDSQQNVGIVGRTGAGKSSLITALFQLQKTEGNIIIDNVNICKEISLQRLRKKISIIPQEPVLFSASLRYNLDPFNEYSDSQLYTVLEEVELKDSLKILDFQVTEGGSNLSVGQRQLICLARAILRNNKILVLDEATANVDQKTDAVIQKVIRNKFNYCTILTIAHRLNTIMDCNKVMVMDGGVLMEYDHPYSLLQNKDGYFYKYVYEMGETAANQLYLIAEQSYFKENEESEQRL